RGGCLTAEERPPAPQGRRGAAPQGDAHAQPAAEPGDPRRAAEEPARGDDRPGPDRNLRLLVQLLPLQRRRLHQAADPLRDPCPGPAPEAVEQLQPQVDREEVLPVRKYSDAQILRIGAITIVVAMLVIAAAMNLSKFPGLRGSTYQAEFSDASGLRKGNMVLVGGMRSGRVKDLELK